MADNLKVGVVGAGVFGSYHAHKCHVNSRVKYVGTYDPNPTLTKKITSVYSAKTYYSYDALLLDVEAVIIASPASTHFEMAKSAIEAGKSVLIEKPIATSKEKARDLVALAAKHNVVLQVGHQERFVLKAIGLYQIASCPMKIETQRLTPYSLRGRDTSVTFDLMIHDIDLVLSLMGNMPSCIEGHTMQVALNHIDASLAFLDFGKTRARLTASRADDVPVRTMRLVYPEGEVNIDFNAKTLVNGTPFDLDENFGQNPIAQDSLAAGLDSFISAIMGVHSVEISGEDGLRAVIVATEIDQN